MALRLAELLCIDLEEEPPISKFSIEFACCLVSWMLAGTTIICSPLLLPSWLDVLAGCSPFVPLFTIYW